MRSMSPTASSRVPVVITVPKSRQLSPATPARGSVSRWPSTAATTASAEGGVVGDQDGLGSGVVLGLGKQVGGDPGGVVLAVGDDQDFRRPGDHVDADGAEDAALGGGHVGVAGARRSWSTGAIVSVPKARAPMAWAPPTR